MSGSGSAAVSIAEHFVEVAPFPLTLEPWEVPERAHKWQAEVSPDEIIAVHWVGPGRQGGNWPLFFESPDPQTAQHSLVGREGWLLGYDSGEFGGGLVEINKQKQIVQTHLLCAQSDVRHFTAENVRGVGRVGERIVVLRGLNHLGTNYGAIEFFRGEIGEGLTREILIEVPGSPEAFAITEANALIAAIPQGVVEIDPCCSVLRVWVPSPQQVLGGSSVARRPWVTTDDRSLAFSYARGWPFYVHHIACRGRELYVGAGPMLIRLAPHQDAFVESWLIERTGELAAALSAQSSIVL